MKRLRTILFLTILSTLCAFAQLPQVLISDFNDANGTNISGVLSFGKIPSNSPADSTLTASNGVVTASNGAGVNHYGGVFWKNAVSNNGTDELIIGVTVPVKSTTPAYQAAQATDIVFYLLANQHTSGFNATIVEFGSWDHNQFSVRFNDITNGVRNAPYGPGQGNATIVPDGLSSDTIYVKISGQTMKVYRSSASGTTLYTTQTARTTLPSSGYCGFEVRASTNPTTQIGAFFLGVATFVPPVCATVDTVKPANPSLIASAGTLDSSMTGYWIARVTELDTCIQKDPGIAYIQMERDTVTGAFIDSIHVVPSTNPALGYRDTTVRMAGLKQKPGNYIVKVRAVDVHGNVYTTQLPYTVYPARTLWVTAYYDVWQMIPLGSAWWAEPPDRLNYLNGISHIILFPNGNVRSGISPFWGPTSGVNLNDSLDVLYGTGRPSNPTHYFEDLIARAHAAGVRVLICVNAVCATELIAVIDANGNGVIDGSDSTRTQTFTNAVASYLFRHGADGVDINIEHGCGNFPGKNNIGLLIRRMRASLDQYSAGIGGKMTFTLSPTSGDQNNYPVADCNNNVDQINPQTYDNQYAWNGCIGANCNWGAGFIYPPGDAPGCMSAGDKLHNVSQHGPQQWADVGYQKRILGVGVSTYGRLRTGSTSRYGAFSNDGYAHNNQNLINALQLNGGAIQPYDTTAKDQVIKGIALSSATYEGTINNVTGGQPFYYTYPTPQRVQDDITYIKTNGFSGYMLFDYQMDCDPTNANVSQRNWIIEAAGQAAGGQQVVTLPSGPTNVSPSANATNQAIFGLTFKWTRVTGATSYHFQISTATDFSALFSEMDLTDTTVTVGQNPFLTSLTNATTYYWRANATVPAGTTSYSTYTGFTTIGITVNPPSAPTLVSPAANATITSSSTTLTISTNGVDTILVNIFQVKIDTNSSTFVMDDSSSGLLTRGIGSLVNGNYYWRAASKNSAGKSAFTGWRKFTVSVTGGSVTVAPHYQMTPYLDANKPFTHNEYPAPWLTFQITGPANIPSPNSSLLANWSILGYEDSLGTWHPYQTVDPATVSKTYIPPQVFQGGLSTPNATVTALNTTTINGTPVDTPATASSVRNAIAASQQSSAAGVKSIKAQGASALMSNVTIAPGPGIGVTQTDSTITISNLVTDSLNNSYEYIENWDAGYGSNTTVASGAGNAAGMEPGLHRWGVKGFGGRSGTVASWGQRYMNHAVDDDGMFGLTITADSARQYHSNGLYCGIWLSPNVFFGAPSIYTIKNKSILHLFISTPSTIDSMAWHHGIVDGTIQTPVPLMDSIRAGIWGEIGNKTGVCDSVYGVTCDAPIGSTGTASSSKVRVGLVAAAANTAYRVDAVYKLTTVDWYVNGVFKKTSTSHVPTTSMHGWTFFLSNENYNSRKAMDWVQYDYRYMVNGLTR